MILTLLKRSRSRSRCYGQRFSRLLWVKRFFAACTERSSLTRLIDGRHVGYVVWSLHYNGIYASNCNIRYDLATEQAYLWCDAAMIASCDNNSFGCIRNWSSMIWTGNGTTARTRKIRDFAGGCSMRWKSRTNLRTGKIAWDSKTEVKYPITANKSNCRM